MILSSGRDEMVRAAHVRCPSHVVNRLLVRVQLRQHLLRQLPDVYGVIRTRKDAWKSLGDIYEVALLVSMATWCLVGCVTSCVFVTSHLRCADG